MADETAEGLLRQRGFRVTPQRQGVLAVFLEHPGWHWSADKLRGRLLSHMPGLARGTTYKVLDELVRTGICEELATTDGTVLYGLRLQPHHHFYCLRCHRWFDVDVTGTEGLALTGDTPSAEISEVAVTFRGVCRGCASDPGPRSEG